MGPYPYERWARLSRVDARLSGHLARALGGLESGLALSDARNVLGAEVTIRRLETRVGIAGAIAVALGESVGLVLALGAQRGVIALAPGIARVIADRVVGGSGRDVALGPTPLSRGEAGLVGYVVARAMARSSAPGSLLDAGHARDAVGAWGAARVVTIAVENPGAMLAARPSATGKDTSSKACTSSSSRLKSVKPSRVIWGIAQMNVSATPRASATRAAASINGHCPASVGIWTNPER